MVDCVLINSPDDFYSQHYLVDPKMPLGLLYIASYLRAHGAKVAVIDCHAHRYTQNDIGQMIESYQPQLVGLNISTPNRKTVYSLAERIKGSAKRCAVILGGPHATCFPEDIMRNAPHIDGIVLGEGELVVLDVLRNLSRLQGFPGFCTDRDIQTDLTAHRPHRILDLDSLPMPAYDLIDVERYLKVAPELYIVAGRGCQYDCCFCCARALWGMNVIHRSPGNVVEELLFLKRKYGVRSFYFYDENIFRWDGLESFLKKLSRLNIRWAAQANINDLDLHILPLLAHSKCYQLSFGLESGSPRIQKYIGKVIRADAGKKISELLRFGISSRAFFMIGFPTETIQEIAETVKYLVELRSLGLSDVAIFPVRQYPGTRLFQDCLDTYGIDGLDDLLEFKYMEDYVSEPDTFVRTKLHKYNTIPSFQINKQFSSLQIRRITKIVYMIFSDFTHFSAMTPNQIAAYLISKSKEA